MATRSDLFHLKFDEIGIEPDFNIRYDYGDLYELMNSIVANGVEVPLHGFTRKDSGLTILTDGHRRLAAIKLGIEEGKIDKEFFKIPLLKGRPLAIEARTLHMLTHNMGKPLSLLEEAMIYDRLEKHGMTVAEISEKATKSSTAINNGLLLMTANRSTKQLIMDGNVAASFVIELLKQLKDPARVDRKLKYSIKAEEKKRAKRLDGKTKEENTEGVIVSENQDIPESGTTEPIQQNNENAHVPEEHSTIKITRKHVFTHKQKPETFSYEQMHQCYEAGVIAEREKESNGGAVKMFDEYMASIGKKAHSESHGDKNKEAA